MPSRPSPEKLGFGGRSPVILSIRYDRLLKRYCYFVADKYTILGHFACRLVLLEEGQLVFIRQTIQDALLIQIIDHGSGDLAAFL